MEHALPTTSTYATWQRWAKVLRRQFERICEIYEVHEEGAEAIKLREYLDRLKLFIDPVAHAQELAQRNYDVKGHIHKLYMLSLTSLEALFREAIVYMPQMSEDMQRLLNSPPVGNCNGRTASDVFKGPHGTEYEGIGTGYTDEDNRLPWKLQRLIEQAEMGGDTYFADGLENSPIGQAEPEHHEGHPDRHDLPRGKRRITATGVQ
jgi:hypothetical protein